MGQYFKLINLDKQEQVKSWDVVSEGKFGGAKFWEWYHNSYQRALIWLLRQSDKIGGGDIQNNPTDYQYLGRWAGDRITLIGDYDESKLWNEAAQKYKDISIPLREEINKVVREGWGFRLGIRDDLI